MAPFEMRAGPAGIGTRHGSREEIRAATVKPAEDEDDPQP
jgi:hypothetical protein